MAVHACVQNTDVTFDKPITKNIITVCHQQLYTLIIFFYLRFFIKISQLQLSDKEKKKQRSLSLVHPLQIVHARFSPGQLFDHVLHFSPKSDQLQGVVQPPGRDAEIRLMRGDVMNPVVLTRQNYVALLQPLDDPRQSAVCVRPLVNLIGERDEDTERQKEAVDGVPRPKLFRRLVVHQVGEEGERRESDETVVSVGFDEVVTSDGERVDVVLTEWTNERLRILIKELINQLIN